MPIFAEAEVDASVDSFDPKERFGCAAGTTPFSLNIAEGLSLLSLVR